MIIKELPNEILIYPFDSDGTFIITVNELGIVWNPMVGKYFSPAEVRLFAEALVKAAEIAEGKCENFTKH